MYHIVHSLIYIFVMQLTINNLKFKTMKTTIDSSITSIAESAKRIIYSFQVLIIGIAIPVLFIIGISNRTQMKQQENVKDQVTNTTQLSPNQVVGFSVVKI